MDKRFAPPVGIREPRRTRALALHVATALTLGVPTYAAATVQAQEAQAAPTATPPRFAEGTPPIAPVGHETESAEVLVEMIINTDGTVRDARVVTPVGNGFDEAALAAVTSWRFEPARRGETAMAARIRYAVRFDPPPPPVEEVPEEVVEEPVEEPLEEEVAEPTEEPAAPEEETPEEELATFGARATVEPPPRDVTRRELTSEVLTRIPGTRGDALRAVELLPGVGRPAFGGGVLLVRGAAPGDSEVFLDGSSVPLLYHFGGLTSFYNSSLIDRISFIPGNFSVRYGRRIGGILEVDPRDPRTDGYHGYVDINLLDASFTVEGPIGDNVSFAVAARRSYIDFFFANVVPAGVFSTVAAPVYYDYQLNVTWRPSTTDRVRFYVYGSSDELRLAFTNPSDNDPNVRGNFGITTQFHRGQISWRHLYEDWLEQDVMVSFGWSGLNFGFGDAVRLQGDFLPVTLRSEWRAQISPQVRLIGGIDWNYIPTTLSFRGPQPTQSEGQPAQAANTGRVDFTANANAYRPALYLESNVRVFDALDVVAGVRLDYFREINSWSVNPRLSTRLALSPQWALRGGVGLFSQPPEFAESAVGVGNPNLNPIRSIHTGLGVDLRFPEERLSFTLDGFYKHITDRVVATTGSVPPFFTNNGLGRIYGMEFGARLAPGGEIPLFGFVSYTLMRSERQDGPDQPWRLFDFDQTHILTASLVWTIGDGWEAGATFRFVTGNPNTPVIGSVNDLSTGTYRPVYGGVNTGRNADFHRLDVRVQKQFRIDDFRLSLYVDVQNVYNNANPEGVTYNFDYSQQNVIGGLPIIPSIGIRGEL
jgi:TonB family protein